MFGFLDGVPHPEFIFLWCRVLAEHLVVLQQIVGEDRGEVLQRHGLAKLRARRHQNAHELDHPPGALLDLLHGVRNSGGTFVSI